MSTPDRHCGEPKVESSECWISTSTYGQTLIDIQQQSDVIKKTVYLSSWLFMLNRRVQIKLSSITCHMSRDRMISCDRDISIFTSSPFHRIRSFSGLHHQHILIHLLVTEFLAKTLKVIWPLILSPSSTHLRWRYWVLEIPACINRGPLLEWLCRCPVCFWFFLIGLLASNSAHSPNLPQWRPWNTLY